jgi:hypothetical protein
MTVDKPTPRKSNAGKKQEAEKDGEKKTSEGNQEVQKTTAKKDKDITCFNCQKKGHYANKCPDRKIAAKESDEEDHLRTLHATWEASVHVTTREVRVHNAVKKPKNIADDEVLLDNKADISIIHPRLLEHIKDSEERAKVNGVGELQLVINKKGCLPDFFEVYTTAGLPEVCLGKNYDQPPARSKLNSFFRNRSIRSYCFIIKYNMRKKYIRPFLFLTKTFQF